MAKDSQYEEFLDTSYPPGSLEARFIDDAARKVKEAQAKRLDQEHYWRKPDEAGYEAPAEGAHRPESARAMVVQLGSNENIPAQNMPQRASYRENLLVRVDGEPKRTNIAGTAWVAVGSVIKQLVDYVKGKFRVAGQLWVGPNPSSLNGVAVGNSGYTFSEKYPAGASPTISTDNITVWPYNEVLLTEVNGSQQKSRIVWPVRVGQFDPESGAFTQEPQGKSYGLGIAVGNWPSDGTLYVFSREGLEVYGNVPNVFFNGVNVAKHDHSGDPGMGVKLDLSSLLSNDPIGQIVSVRGLSLGVQVPIATNRNSPTLVKSWTPAEYFEDQSESSRPHMFVLNVRAMNHTDGGSSARYLYWVLRSAGSVLGGQIVPFFGPTMFLGVPSNAFQMRVFLPAGAISSSPLELYVYRVSDNESGQISFFDADAYMVAFRA